MGYDVLTPDPVSEDEITTGRNAMVRLFSPESFRDYITSDPITRNNFKHNGTVVLQPSSCYLEITAINDSWQLTLTHPYDQEGRFTYISRGCVLEVPCKVAREQENEEQLFRIFEVRDSFGQLEALAYPIAMESSYETPIYYHEWIKVTAKQFADSLSSINSKYKVTTDWLMKNDLQEQINEVNDRLRQLQVGGNVNLLKRPEIDAQLLVDAGWTEAGTGIATVYSSTFSNEQETKFYNFTPIVDDPVTGEFKTVFGPARLTRYAEAVIAGSRQDDYACQIGGPFNSLDAALDAADEIHELHDELHDLTKNHPNVLRSIYASETNLQGLIQGDSDFTFVGAFNTEVAYDNFTYIVNRKLGDKNSAKLNKVFYAVNMAGIEITENTNDLITRIYPMSAEGIRYTDAAGNYSYVNSSLIEEYPIVYARVIKYDGIKEFEEHSAEDRVPQTALQKLTQDCKAKVKARVRTLSRKYLERARQGLWDHTQYIKHKFVDDGNQAYLTRFSWLDDGKGFYYGDGKSHYLKNAWVEDAPNKHYWVNDKGYWDPGYDDTSNIWEWYTDSKGRRYGKQGPGGNSVYCKHQWIRCKDPDKPAQHKWCWFNNEGYYVKDTDSADAQEPIRYSNPHGGSEKYDERKDRFALPYGYIFYSYTDAIEYLKDMALIDISKEYDSLEMRVDASTDVNELSPSEMRTAKQEIWDLFADAIQQGFKWCETTDIAEWDWREITPSDENGEKNWLGDYKWHEEYVDAQRKIVPKAQSVGTLWWYGVLEKKQENGKEVKVYHCIRDGWVEESRSKHYYCDSSGWWDSAKDDTSEWAWQVSENKDWYGSTTVAGKYAKNQYIYDTQAGKWYWLDSNGYWTLENSRWKFGNKSNTDFINLAWKKVGNVYWWFDRDGFLDPYLAYCDEFTWRTDDDDSDDSNDDTSTTKKYYYGDEDNHILRNCWVEDSNSVHKLLDEDGYYYETSESDSSSTTTDTTDEDTSGEDSSDDSEDDDDEPDTSSKDDRTGVTYDNEPWSWHADDDPNGGTRYWYGRYYQDYKGVEDTSKKQYYARDQWMYVSENKAWYKFDDNGWCTAAWVSKETWEWHKDDNGWWYGDGQGGESTYFRGQWAKIDNKWYFFDVNGYADPNTDDFESSKTESNVSATLETNRDGINRVYDDAGVGSATTTSDYNEKREGVQAWITKAFIEEIKSLVNEQHKRLKDDLNARLKEQALKDVELYAHPTLTIEVDMALLDKMDGYEQYAFLHDLYLGDYVKIYYPQYGYKSMLDERVVGLTYDCLEQKISKLTLGSPKNVIYRRTAALTANTGVIVEGSDTDVLETGYESGEGTRYAEASRRVQYIEG